MSYETIFVDARDRVTTVTLNRPDKLNAFSPQMSAELMTAFRDVERDANARIVVLTGAGRGFCAGADLTARRTTLEAGQRSDSGDGLRTRYYPLLRRMWALPKIIVGAINGVAAGAGVGLALACDVRIMSDSASLLQAFVRIGLVPDAGNFYHLTRMVGLSRAFEHALLAESVPAAEAVRIGLVTRAVPPAELPAAAHELAVRLAGGPATAQALIKRGLYRSVDATLEETLEYEAQLQKIAAATADFREGVSAFLEKRSARFA